MLVFCRMDGIFFFGGGRFLFSLFLSCNCMRVYVHYAMENCLDLAIRTEGAVGNVAPTIDKNAAYSKGERVLPFRYLLLVVCTSGGYFILCFSM